MDVNPYESPTTEPEKRQPIEPQQKQNIVNIGTGVGAIIGMLAVFALGAYGVIAPLILVSGGAFVGALIAGLIAIFVLRK